MPKVSFDVSKEQDKLINLVADRAESMGMTIERADICLDFAATIAQGQQLDLQKLLEFDDFSFAHDVVGIRNHIDTSTGTLRNCFLPRCAR